MHTKKSSYNQKMTHSATECQAMSAVFVLNEQECQAIKHELHHYEDARAVSIEAL